MASVPKLLLLVLCSYHALFANAGGDRSYKVVSIDSLKSGSVCPESEALIVSVTSQSTGVSTDGPCSMPSLDEILRQDQLRAAYIQRKFSVGDQQLRAAAYTQRKFSGGDAAKAGGAGGVLKLLESDAMVPVMLGSSLEYAITVGIGSPAVNQTMLIDTGSDVPWVQCKPCSQCHSQEEPLFDPSTSSTYSPISCSSATCTKLEQDKAGNGCSNSECQYYAKYGDGSRTSGTYSSDTLTLGSTTIPNFQFGCGRAQSGMHEKSAGLMGLGGGAQSLVTQTSGTFGTAFSYCLPATSSSPGFLKLGAGTGGSGFAKTPMIRSSPIPTYYGLRLEGIRVGGKQLEIPTSVFSSGLVVDSGAVVSRLPKTAYSALSAAFKEGMKKYQLAPPGTSSVLDPCYDFSGSSDVELTSVALVLSGGGVVELSPEGILLERKGRYYCLALAGNSDDTSFGVIGNVAQRTIEVMYDIGGETVGFKTGAC
ncbi:unnamed protein product [Urochloa decumbens]|uniref:Peptidase A1 domain-containing protein n=1 Tax=Urochloa decumbens TaxID=240449 RepID=A0ABC9CJ75_9POAL